MATIAVRASPHVSWKRTTRGGVLAFGVFALAVAVVMGMRTFGIGPAASLLAAGRLNDREPLLVTDFTVKQGDSTLAGVVAEAMRASLAQSNAISLVPSTTVASALQRMQRPAGARLDLPLARDIAQREGIRAIVDGDVTQLGGGYVVTVRLVTADSGLTLARVQKAVDGPKELIAAVDEIGRALRGKMGESLRSVQNAPSLERVTTPSIEALRLYSEGRRAYSMEADVTQAISRLRLAVVVDPGFAMAWRLLGSVYIAGGFPQASIDSAQAQAYRFRDRLTPRERLVTETSYFMSGGQNRVKAAAASEQLLAAGDSEVTTLINYGVIAGTRRQYAKAESLLLAAVQLGQSQTASHNLVNVQVQMGKLSDAQQTIDQAMKRFPSQSARGAMLMQESWVRYAEGDLDRSERLIDSLATNATGTARSRALNARAMHASLRGRVSQVPLRLAALRSYMASDGVRTVPLDDSIRLSFIDVTTSEQPARAVRRLDATLAAVPLHTLAPTDRRYFEVATVYARAGRIDKAKAILAQRAAEVRDTARLRNEQPLLHRAFGEIAIAEGRPADAVREFWKGDSLPDGPKDQCDACTYVNVARAYDKANMPDSAIVYLEKYLASRTFGRLAAVDFAARAPATRRLGELYDAKSDRANAAHYYQAFVDLWKSADPELQPQVAEVRKRLARLGDVERK